MTRYRSAVTGKFVSRAFAEANPAMTVSESEPQEASHPCGLPDAFDALGPEGMIESEERRP